MSLFIILLVLHAVDALNSSTQAPVEFVMVFGAQRAASTSIADALGSHMCATSFNEFTGHPRFAQALPDSEHDCMEAAQCDFVRGGCNGPRWLHRTTNILDVFKESRNAWCTRNHSHPRSPWPSCQESCVVSSKFHAHLWHPDVISAAMKESLKQMMAYPGTRVVLVERIDLAAQECSLNYSLATDIWHGGDHAVQDRWKQEHCSGKATQQFKKRMRGFYSWVRKTLEGFNKTYFDLPYEKYVANPKGSEAQLHSFAGLPPQSYRASCVDGCNCGYSNEKALHGRVLGWGGVTLACLGFACLAWACLAWACFALPGLATGDKVAGDKVAGDKVTSTTIETLI